MHIKISTVRFVVLAITIVLFVFEQVLILMFGFDSILKPYRVAVMLGVILLIVFPVKIASRIKVISLSLAGLYIFGAFIALLWIMVGSGSYERLMHQFVLFFIAYCIYLMVVYNIRSVDDLEKIFLVILLSVLASSVIWFINGAGINIYRVAGFFNNPNHFGYSLSVAILISLYYLYKFIGRRLVIVLLIINIIILLTFLYLSGSRAAIFALIVTVSIVFYRYMNIYKGKSVGSALIVALTTVLAYSLIRYIFDNNMVYSYMLLDRYKFENMVEASGRFDLMRSGFIAIIDYLGLGMGMGQYIEHHQKYINQVSGYVYNTVLEYDLGLHNEYLGLFVEFGIIPLILYVCILYVVWRGVSKIYKYMPYYSMYAIVIEGIFVFDLMFSFSQDMYTFPFHWIVLGLGVSLMQLGVNSSLAINNMKSKDNM